MGYYVKITDANFVIPADKVDDAYEAVCELNQHNELKTGGAFPRTDKDGPHDKIWFSWMSWDYPEVCDDLLEVLEMVGFEVEFNMDDGLSILGYDSKTGCEQTFLAALAPFAKAGSFINWEGEDGDLFRHQVEGGELVFREGRVTWSKKHI
jgi:hypothetical protein